MDEALLREGAREFLSVLSGSQVFYAVKANSDAAVLKIFADESLGFEISSSHELRRVRALGIGPERIRTSNPVKDAGFIRQMHRLGCDRFVFDSEGEAEKIAAEAPGAEVIVRLTVDNSGSAWPLSDKFGVEIDEACRLLVEATSLGLNAAGATFHVGSQCVTVASWTSALRRAAELWDRAREHGLRLRILNVGGGLPAHHDTAIASTAQTLTSIVDQVRELFPSDVEVEIEPGRALVADAGALITTVIGRAQRDELTWLYADAGIFNGLMEAVGGIEYRFVPLEAAGREAACVIAGPSCDSMDIVAKNVLIAPPSVGERLLVFPGGAYTTVYASRFNGIRIPRLIVDRSDDDGG
jgi:ornithine decarboxylase